MSCGSSEHYINCKNKKYNSVEFYNNLYNLCNEWIINGIII